MSEAVRESQKDARQITEALSRDLHPDAPAQQAPRPQATVPPELPRMELVAAAGAQSEPVVLEIKRPAANGAATAREEVPPTIQTAPAEPLTT